MIGLTRPGLEPTIYRTQGEHANHYANDAVDLILLTSIVGGGIILYLGNFYDRWGESDFILKTSVIDVDSQISFWQLV